MVYVDHYPESGVEIFKERADGSAVLALYNNKETSIGPDGHEQIQADVLFLNQRVKNVEDVTKNFDVYWKKLAAQARADLITNYTVAVQNMMDRTAQTRGYDSIFTLCSYSNSTNTKFAAEATAAVKWRDAVWEKCYEIEDVVDAGTIPAPSLEELLKMMPSINW